MAGLGYASAFGTGIGLAIAGWPFPLMAGAVIWPLAVLCALPATRLRYLKAAGRDKERMQWLGTGLVVAATVALISAVLHLLVGWPESAGAVAASASAAVPLAVILAEWPPLARHGGARAGARALDRGFGRRGGGRLPGHRARPRGGARRRRRPEDPRLLHRRGRPGGDRIPADQGPAGRLRHQVRVRHPGGARRDAAHVRQPDDPRRVNGRAAAPAGRVAAQDHAPGLRRGLYRRGRRAGTRGVGARRERQVDRADRPRAAGRGAGRGVGERVGLGLAARPAGRARAGSAAGGADQPRGRAARPHRGGAGRPRRHLHRGGRPRADRAGPPGRPGLPQLPARLRAADHAERAAQAGGRAARIAGPRRRQRGRRTPPGRTRPARRGAAAPGGAGHQPPPGPRHRAGRPGRGRSRCSASWPATCS